MSVSRSWRSRAALGRLTAIVLVLAGAWACEPAEEEGEAPEAPGEAPAVQPAPEATLPDTTAEALWAYLQQVKYQQNWPMWPNKGRLYKGIEPHGALLTTYVNPVTLDALTNKAGVLPEGAIVVKENYAPDSTLAAITTMYKVRGYDPEGGDWYWTKFFPDGSVEVTGRAEMCASCHGENRDNDYIMTASIK